MIRCESSEQPITLWQGMYVEIKHDRFYSQCPICDREVQVIHKQRPDSDFTKNTGFPDMVPYFIIHYREEELSNDSEYDTLRE
jgi:hypothetical protein